MLLFQLLTSIVLSSSVSHAVVGGRVVDHDQIPQAVVRLKKIHQNSVEYCTGTLIGPQTILTAAHCLGKSLRLIDKYRPTIEVTYFQDGRELTIETTRYLAHPDYENNEKADLALIYLERAINLNEYPKLSNVKEDDHLHVLGFGLNGSGDRIDGKLRETFIEVDHVRTRYFSSFNIEHGPCSGDSGGAVYRVGSQAQEILGVTYYVNPTLNEEQQSYLAQVNWDREQLMAAYPYVGKFCLNSTSYFMNISHYKEWVEENRKGSLQ